MKNVLLLSILLCAIAGPAFGELTLEDLDKIRLIIKEEIEDEVNPIRGEISSIKEDVASLEESVVSIEKSVASLNVNVASLSGRMDGVEKQITWLMAIIIVAVGIPPVIVAWRSRKDREQDKRIEELAREIEALKQQRIVNP